MKSAIREILETIILTVIIFLLVRSVVQNFKVEGRSMEPTLQSGQYLLINKAVYWRFDPAVLKRISPRLERFVNEKVGNNEGKFYIFGQPQHGDVIVFKYPKDTSRDFIKRVIALPGETVEIKQGHVYVNDQPLDENYILDKPNYYVEKQRVPPNSFFVLGDNRNNSLDSHVWGMVPVEDIIGKAWLCYWPAERWGLIPSTTLLAQPARQGQEQARIISLR
ncbi:MAG: signal peptidase I [Chloroflexi bacterium]|nr:signal peptidase I [Chloroflexota bacterium]MDA8189343.1 signal peptidase I [Dehalococcoidales bacterium]